MRMASAQSHYPSYTAQAIRRFGSFPGIDNGCASCERLSQVELCVVALLASLLGMSSRSDLFVVED